jgi:hypothetical protein
MDHNDAEMADIVVVMDDGGDAAKLDSLAAALRGMGITVEEVDHDNGVIEGTSKSEQVAAIQKIPGVKYVRKVFEYVADYPAGDPRDQDKEDSVDEDIPR